MSVEPDPTFADEPDEELEPEVVDGLPVVASVRPLEARRPAAVVTLAQGAAVAATGFLAGAATAAVFGRRIGKQLARARAATPRGLIEASAPQPLEVVATRSFIVDVHLLARREQ